MDVTLDQVLDTRLVLEELVAESAARRATEADIGPIRDILDAEADTTDRKDRLLHAQLAALTDNPLLDLFVDILTRVGDYYFSDSTMVPPQVPRQARKAHAGIADAVLANNPGLARERMRRHLLTEAELIPRNGSGHSAASGLGGPAGRCWQQARRSLGARHLHRHPHNADLRPGDFVGSEASLMRERAVSRAVLREAIRILEYHQIALMRRGPGGGLFVAAPDPAALTDIVAIYLRRRGISQDHFAECATASSSQWSTVCRPSSAASTMERLPTPCGPT